MRLLLTIAVYIGALITVAAVAFGTLMALANSTHVAWLAAYGLDGAVPLIISWIAVLLLPALAAGAAWRRLKRKSQ